MSSRYCDALPSAINRRILIKLRNNLGECVRQGGVIKQEGGGVIGGGKGVQGLLSMILRCHIFSIFQVPF